jgi:hypothetical protein
MNRSLGKSKRSSSKGKFIAFLAVSVLSLASVGGVVSAASKNSDDGLAQRLATKFNLNKDEVSAELDSYRQERDAARESEMKQKMEEALQTKVDEGKLTAEQKSALLTKLEELHAKHKQSRESGEEKTKEERDSEREAEKSELDAWAKEQGISDLNDILPKPDKPPIKEEN